MMAKFYLEFIYDVYYSKRFPDIYRKENKSVELNMSFCLYYSFCLCHIFLFSFHYFYCQLFSIVYLFLLLSAR